MSAIDGVAEAQWDALNRSIVTARVVSAMVHDARNSLQGISGTAELLTMSIGDESRTDDRVKSILQQCVALGDRFEAFRALTTPGLFSLQRLDLLNLFERAVELRQASWAPRRVTASISIDPDTSVKGDAGDLLRVVLNLFLNAEQSMAALRRGQINVDAEPFGEAVRVIVEDVGPGVPEAGEPGLFQLFQPDGRVTTGLWASRRLSEASGGTLRWLGRSGRRSAFELVLRSAQ